MSEMYVIIASILVLQFSHVTDALIQISCRNAQNCISPSCASGCDTLPTFPSDVTDINITSESIKAIQADAFSNLTNLRRIQITSSSITRIASHAFRGVSGLDLLNIAASTIGVIQTSAFHGLHDIGTVSVTDCRVAIIRSNAFSGFRNIVKFTFSNTRNAQTFRSNTFTDYEAVTTMSICNHDIREIQPNAISDIRITDEFEFCQNNVILLPARAISNVRAPNLYIWMNVFGNIDPGTLKPLIILNGGGFQLNNNRFRCDCGEAWLLTNPYINTFLERNSCYSDEFGKLQTMDRLDVGDLGVDCLTTTIQPRDEVTSAVQQASHGVTISGQSGESTTRPVSSSTGVTRDSDTDQSSPSQPDTRDSGHGDSTSNAVSRGRIVSVLVVFISLCVTLY